MLPVRVDVYAAILDSKHHARPVSTILALEQDIEACAPSFDAVCPLTHCTCTTSDKLW